MFFKFCRASLIKRFHAVRVHVQGHVISVSPEVAQLTEESSRQEHNSPGVGRLCVQGVVDEVANIRCKAPVVGAIPVQVGYRHSSMTKSAK